MSIQCQEQRGPLLHNPHAGVGMPVDAPLVTLRFAEEALQIQIVLREIQQVAPANRPGAKLFITRPRC